jgi:hypothetical protein
MDAGTIVTVSISVVTLAGTVGAVVYGQGKTAGQIEEHRKLVDLQFKNLQTSIDSISKDLHNGYRCHGHEEIVRKLGELTAGKQDK